MELKAKLGPEGKAIKGTFEMTRTETFQVQEGQVLKNLQQIDFQIKQLEAQKKELLEVKNEIDKLSAKAE